MEMRYRYKRAWQMITAAERIVLVAHKKPDGDALGATSALLTACLGLGFDAVAYCKDPVPIQYRYLANADRFTTDKRIFDVPEPLVVVIDSGDLAYAGVADVVRKMKAVPKIVNIDHHVTNDGFGDVQIVDTGASSASEVIFEFMTAVGIQVDQDMATSLMTGILFDTHNFTNPGTTVRSLEVASELLGRGARMQDITRFMMRNKPVHALRTWGQVFDRLKYDAALGVASTAVFLKDIEEGSVDDDHIEGMSNFLNKFLDVKAVLVLKEMADGKVKGSFRSAEDVDVSEVARALGGGGHKKAAGFTIHGRIVEDTDAWRVEAHD